MPTIFGRIRKRLLSSSTVSKYFLYALGEVTLIVIGILLALKVGDLNTSRKNHHVEWHYLRSLQDEIEVDSMRNARLLGERMIRKISVLKQTNEYLKGGYEIVDTLSFLRDVGYGGIFSRANTFEHSPTFDELLFTGNIKLIRDDWVRSGIMNYYETQTVREQYVNRLRTEYATYIAGLMPFDPSNPEDLDHTNYEWILSNLDDPAFRKLVNEELHFAYNLREAAERLNTSLNGLLNRIRTQYQDL